MDKINIPGTTNGIPFNWDDLEFILGQGSYEGGIIQAINAILTPFGSNFIVQGCDFAGGNYTEGWIFLDGEILKVDAHAATGSNYWQKVTTNNADGNKQTQLSGTVDIYQQNRGKGTAVSGTLLADGNEPRWFAPGWNTITLINGWDGAGTARYRVHMNGTLEIDIFLDTNTASGITNDILGQLPAGSRPARIMRRIIPYNVGPGGSGQFRYFAVNTAGQITIDYTATDNYNHSFIIPLL